MFISIQRFFSIVVSIVSGLWRSINRLQSTDHNVTTRPRATTWSPTLGWVLVPLVKTITSTIAIIILIMSDMIWILHTSIHLLSIHQQSMMKFIFLISDYWLHPEAHEMNEEAMTWLMWYEHQLKKVGRWVTADILLLTSNMVFVNHHETVTDWKWIDCLSRLDHQVTSDWCDEYLNNFIKQVNNSNFLI